MRLIALFVALSMSAATIAGCASSTDESTGEDRSDISSLDAPSPKSLFHDPPAMTASERAQVLAKYSNIQHPGVREALFEDAMIYFDTNKAQIPNKDYVTIVDFKLDSGHKRFFILDMNGGAMTEHMVAHGHNSDPNDTGMATQFSNTINSNESSVGYFLTAETYDGVHGESLKIDGLSDTNDNVRERVVVIHSAAYVSNSNTKQGRSNGCFALTESEKPEIVLHLKHGSLMYAMN